MPFEPYRLQSRFLDCRTTEQRRFQTHTWICEARFRSVFRHAKARRRSLRLASDRQKIDKLLFRPGYVKLVRCIYTDGRPFISAVR
ncbi:hypothetical protein EPB69_17020 [Geobacillus stearothermophilus]|nr:hypothetical protein EPB69_17020 [Geobacillus stearothermophilus]